MTLHRADRRRFLGLSMAAGAAALLPSFRSRTGPDRSLRPAGGPLILSTWEHGLSANARAWEILQQGGSVLDAVEQGVAIVESDLTNRSVGLGGMPDRDGKVTLDACIQDHDGRAGSVAFVQEFENPIAIARAVMEKTPHVMLVGSGAERWALENGFTKRRVEIPEVRKAWKEWLKTSQYQPKVNTENERSKGRGGPRGNIHDHDTIGMIAMDAAGRMAGSCTTSGMAWKVHGRVGDSPIIGAGLFVDGEVGAACATGVGELVIRTAGSHAIVELMRQGMEPMEACREVVQRILRKNPGLADNQVGFLALRRDGVHGAWSIYNGFNYALRDAEGEQLVDASSDQRWDPR